MTKRDPDAPCEKCGVVHQRCKGHNRRGTACGERPAVNQAVCRFHGGASPIALSRARERAVAKAAEAELRQRWARGEEAAIEDPVTELNRLAAEAVAFKDYLRDQVTGLEGLITYWTERTWEPEEGPVRTEAVENMRAVVAAYERSLDRTAKILASMVKLDLAGRLLELNQTKAAMIVDAVRYGLGQVDMAAEVRAAAQDAIADAIAGLSHADPQPKELTA